MLSGADYIRMSLDLNLFFLRIMKEHSFFLEAAFTAKNTNQMQSADCFSKQFGMFLHEAIQLSDGVLSPNAIGAGQFFTPYTLDAEKASQYYSGIPIDTTITQQEQNLEPGTGAVNNPSLVQKVSDLNRRAMESVAALASFKSRLLSSVLSCKLFMNTYPLLIDHILREAVFYHGLLAKLQRGMDIRTEQDLIEQEVFWNRIMAEHAKFIRGLLDPTEVALFDTADMFGHQFDALMAESMRAQDNPALAPQATADSLAAAHKIRDFKAAGTQGILECKIRSMIIPLLGDHTLREANHFIFLLNRGDAV